MSVYVVIAHIRPLLRGWDLVCSSAQRPSTAQFCRALARHLQQTDFEGL